MARVLQRICFQEGLSSIRYNQYSSKYGALSLSQSNLRQYGSKCSSGDNIVSSPQNVDAVVGMTIPEFFRQTLSTYENMEAMVCGLTGRRYTHGQIYKAGQSFATALLQSGLKRRDIVCIALPNLPEFPIVYLGIWDAGLISSAMNPTYTADEYARQLQNVKCKAIVTIPLFLPTILEAKKRCPDLKSIIVIGEPQADCHSFFQMMKVDSSGTEFLKGSQIDTTQEVATIPFSSGTTGPPKGVMLTHSNYATNITQFLQESFRLTKPYDGTEEQDKLMGLLPFFHAYGKTCILGGALYQGASVVTLPKFDPASFVKAIRDHKPTVMHMVTPLISFIANSPEIGSEELVRIKAITGGGAPVGQSLINKLLGKSNKPFLYQEGYGMTECNAVSHIVRPEHASTKIGSCGSIVPGTKAKIVNMDTGEALGPNENGEICIKGPQVMKGYFNNEKATAETIDADKWLHTGDIGYYDNDNCFFIVDRLKELIKVKGLQVSPSELEDILRHHEGVADVAVIGVPDEKYGEVPRAYVVKRAQDLSASNIHEYLDKKVSSHKKLAGGIQFIDAIPKAASGKILRRELKQDYLKSCSK